MLPSGRGRLRQIANQDGQCLAAGEVHRAAQAAIPERVRADQYGAGHPNRLQIASYRARSRTSSAAHRFITA